VVDLTKLDVVALKRYQRHFGLRTKTTKMDKEELVRVVSKHFAALVVDEEGTIQGFVNRLVGATHHH